MRLGAVARLFFTGIHGVRAQRCDGVFAWTANATRDGLTSEANITRAVTRTLRPLFRAGRFDAVDTVEWSKFGAKDVGAALHLRIRDEAALQSFVLLKHDGDVLPLAAGKHIAVLGPQSSGQGLFSDYFGDDICCELVGSLCCFPPLGVSEAAA